jgi:hypothetical protein
LLPVRLPQSRADPLGEGLHATDQHGQLALQLRLVRLTPGLFLQVRDPLAEPPHPRLALLLLQESFGIAVDEPGEPLAQRGDLPGELRRLLAARGRHGRQPAAILARQPFRLLEDAPDFPPDRHLDPVAPQLPIGANRRAPEAVALGTAAAVVHLPARRDRLARVGVAAPRTDEQALEQVAHTVGAAPRPPLVLRQLLLRRGEEVLGDERRTGMVTHSSGGVLPTLTAFRGGATCPCRSRSGGRQGPLRVLP